MVIAAGAAPPFFVEVAAVIVAGAVIAYVCYRLGLVPIVGFLVAGVVIGPNGLGFVTDPELVDAAAEVGVILLLFTIGIEFSLEKLAAIKTLIFGGGGMQVGLATGVTIGLLMAFGVGWQAALFTGFLVALSSTAIVLKLLADRGETNTEHGQVALGLLIFQDLAIIVMVLLVPMLAGTGGTALDLGIALGTAALLIAAVLVIARRVMPRVLEAVARTCSPELFLLTVIAICFGTAYLTSLAGVSLSLGAFLAGLVVSESRFSEHAMSEILPLQILFSATFFVSVGMLLDVGFLVTNLPIVVGVIAAVLLIKVVTTGLSVRALGYGVPTVAASSLLLAQVGEFSFVLERAGREVGLTPAGMGEAGSQTFIAATVVLMVATPLLARLGTRFGRKMATAEETAAMDEMMAEETGHGPMPHLSNHVVVAGYGKAARRLVRILEGSGIPYLVTTLSPAAADELQAEGLPVLPGDATKQRTLELVGIDRAKLLVIADDNPSVAHRIIAVARPLNPTMRILVRTRYIAEIEGLAHAGADRVVPEELESIVQLFDDVLRTYQVDPEEIARHEAALRESGYEVLRVPTRSGVRPIVECELDEHCFDTRTVTLHEGAPAVGRALGDLGLGDYGLTAESLRQNGTVHPVPPADTVLRAGDVLVLGGSVDAFARAAALFRADAAGESTPEPPPKRAAIDTDQLIRFEPQQGTCAHVDEINAVTPSAPGCEACLEAGDTWIHLRICTVCGHVGCCDSSKNKHATKHHHATGHAIVRSLEPGETWGWCYVDERML